MMFRLLLTAVFLSHAIVANSFAQPAAAAESAPPLPGREKIGEALGKPVYRDEIRSKKKQEMTAELYRLFARPAVARYREKHKAEIEPTETELTAAQKALDREHAERTKDERPQLLEKQREIQEQLKSRDLTDEVRRKLNHEQSLIDLRLKPPGRMFARFVLNNWKFQKHLYDTYGGGRILWQQAGLEAYDANRKWLEDLEAKGEFKITDAALRGTFYEYWTSQDGSPFLIEDPERIRKEFLEPTWSPKVNPRRDSEPEKAGN